MIIEFGLQSIQRLLSSSKGTNICFFLLLIFQSVFNQKSLFFILWSLLNECKRTLNLAASICHLASLNSTFCLEVYYKFRTNSNFALNIDWAAHLLNDLLANAETKAGPLLIALWIFVKLVKVNKKFFETFLGHTNTRVNNSDLEIDKSILTFKHIFFWLLLFGYPTLLNPLHCFSLFILVNILQVLVLSTLQYFRLRH